jgi:NhaA family Na+:H+ antiporter
MPIQINLSKLFNEFYKSEKASGIILILCTVGAMLVANSPIGGKFLNFWQLQVGIDLPGLHLENSLKHWIDDGLMAIFFLLIGLEIERELYIGELSNIKNALLPIFAAAGGMLIPALLYIAFNHGTETQSGFGIPMATDIAFSLGLLALLGNRVPAIVKIFLTAFAIIDDLGAVIVIALFYSHDLSVLYLFLGIGIFAILLLFNRLGVRQLVFYLLPAVVMWYMIRESGLHAAIAGVLLAFAIPFRGGEEDSPSYKLQHFLHKPVAFMIMPLFALANTGVPLAGDSLRNLAALHTLGIYAGLVIGKPLGITLFSLLAVKAKLTNFPNGLTLRHLIGAGFLGGIGFTMSIFITFLAFGDTTLGDNSKITIMLASLTAGIIGFAILRQCAPEDLKNVQE